MTDPSSDNLAAVAATERTDATVTVDWERTTGHCRTALSLLVCVEPPLRREARIHDALFEALRGLRVDYARLGFWRPYPKLAVAALERPANGQTSWDFSLIDPIVTDFMRAAEGRPVVMNFSTPPQWMFETSKPVHYPEDPDQIIWNYEQGTELVDRSVKEVADYYARMVRWYTQGGFEDECGHFHRSNHRFTFDYFEVLNEVDQEHEMTPESYTALYDAIVGAVRAVDPAIKFGGPSLTPGGAMNPAWFEHFLDPRNHKPGIPVDMVSYHFYAFPNPDESPDIMQHTMFAQADGFVNAVRYIESIRQRLSPETETHINEIGTILPDSTAPVLLQPIPDSYWNLSGAMFAYLFIQLARMGIDVLHESELIDYPGQYAGTTLVHWDTGKPTARYWVLRLLAENFGKGDRFVHTQTTIDPPANAGYRPSIRSYIAAQAFTIREGRRKLLVVNKRDRAFSVHVTDVHDAEVAIVDQTSGFNAPRATRLQGGSFALGGFGVAVVTLPS